MTVTFAYANRIGSHGRVEVGGHDADTDGLTGQVALAVAVVRGLECDAPVGPQRESVRVDLDVLAVRATPHHHGIARGRGIHRVLDGLTGVNDVDV